MKQIDKKAITQRQKQGLTFCRKGYKAPNLARKNRCDKCGFTIRGINHLSGIHCRNGTDGRTGGTLIHRHR
jgi:hypothetical protein